MQNLVHGPFRSRFWMPHSINHPLGRWGIVPEFCSAFLSRVRGSEILSAYLNGPRRRYEHRSGNKSHVWVITTASSSTILRPGATASIDTPAQPINNALAEQGWTLTHILNTHHHFDHAGGNEELKAHWGCEIIGVRDAERIPGIDRRVVDGEVFHLGNTQVRVLEVPGHTVGHIAYYFAEDRVPLWGIPLP